MIDNLVLLAIAAFGWGLSLATYRMFARHNGWPMGALHADLPAVPILIGIFSLLAGILFAAFRGEDNGGWVIIGCGALLAFSWTGFLRVGSQVSLLLAPFVTAMLLFGWLAEPFFGYNAPKWAAETPKESYSRAKTRVKQGIGNKIEDLREESTQ
ncbi:MAG: hypothetical protein ACRBCJ_00900 [Hyphomicrobiaceae bacterium]